jgi:hypothetical protein
LWDAFILIAAAHGLSACIKLQVDASADDEKNGGAEAPPKFREETSKDQHPKMLRCNITQTGIKVQVLAPLDATHKRKGHPVTRVPPFRDH